MRSLEVKPKAVAQHQDNCHNTCTFFLPNSDSCMTYFVLKVCKGKTSVYAIHMWCGRQFIYFIQTTCAVWFIFLSGKWRNTNDKKLDRTNCRNKRDNTTVMNSNCSQINQSTGMYSQSNIRKIPSIFNRIFSYIVLTIVLTVHTTYELIMLE